MQAESDRHFADDLLEKYSMGRLPDEQIPSLEEHLLICSACQVRLTSIDEFVFVTKSAAAEFVPAAPVRKPPMADAFTRRFWNMPKPVWAVALATLALTALVIPKHQNPVLPLNEVVLTADRGAGAQLPSVSSQSEIRFKIDASTLAPSPSYGVQLVDRRGGQVWRTQVTPQDHQIAAVVPKQLTAGNYWVRIFAGADSSSPVQEYGLSVK